MESRNGLPVILFKDQKSWSAWLAGNFDKSSGVWLRLSKKSSSTRSVSYDEAVESALCYGWIDGMKQKYDESFWLQKFTPRGPKSIWSKINRGKAETLIRTKQMKPSGLKVIEAAREDGRWEAAYDSPSTASVPADFQKELKRSPKAKAFYDTLNRANTYAILFRIHHAKDADKRARLIQKFIDMLEKKEKLHP